MNFYSFYAFKGFDWNLRCCNDFQYEIGKTYTLNEEPILCERGFHFCKRLTDVFFYYPRYCRYPSLSYTTNNRYCLVEVFGDEKYDADSRKGVTNAIRIIKELTKEEINEIVDKEEGEKLAKNYLQNQYLLNIALVYCNG